MLQRIAVCYLVVGLFYLWDRRVWTKVAALVVALVGYWVLVRWVPVPGAGMPGRDIPFMDQRMNLVSWLDRLLMPHHLYLDWSGPDLHNVRDPEGLLSDLPAIWHGAAGAADGAVAARAAGGQGEGAGTGVHGGDLPGLGYFWSLEFPLNKNMWTSSYVLVAAGWSLTVLTLAFCAVDLLGWGRDKNKALLYPWLVLGSNAITAYMFSEIVPGLIESYHFHDAGRRINPLEWMQAHVFIHLGDPGLAAFAFSVFTLSYCFIPVWLLYRKGIFVKV